MIFLTGVVSTGYAMRLGQYPMTNQKILVLIAGIIHGKPILDIFLRPLPPIIQLCNAEHGRRIFFAVQCSVGQIVQILYRWI